MTDEPSPQIELERYLNRMRTGKDLANELGVSPDYISTMKWNGFSMPGGKASIRMARTFIEECEPFGVLATKRRPRLPEQSDASSGKSHGPTRKRVQRKPSSDSRKNRLHKAV